jgi:hypothetical protein
MARVMEQQGVLEISFLHRGHSAQIAEAAEDGDEGAARIMDMLAAALEKIEDPSKDTPCLTCNSKFTRRTLPSIFVVLETHEEGAHRVLVNGVCVKCRRRHPGKTLRARIIDTIKQNAGVEMRELPQFSEPGRA